MPPAVSSEDIQVHPRIPTMKEFNKQKQENKENSTDYLKKSGILTIVTEEKRRVTVCAKVYNNGYDHFMLLSSKSSRNTCQKYVNLKQTHVTQIDDHTLRITSIKGIDAGHSLTIIPSKDIVSWLKVSTSEVKKNISSPFCQCNRAQKMPALQESDEE